MKLKTTSLIAALAVGASLSLLSLPAFAAKTPYALATYNRVKQVAYDPNQVYELVGTYGFQTSVEFAPDETVKVVTVGVCIACQIMPYEKRLFLNLVETNAMTKLNLITKIN